MEDKPLTDSINKQYSKYGSLRIKEKESRIELCNAEDPLKFLTRIDSSIKDAKARVKKSIDNSTISEDYESSYDQQPNDNDSLDTIPMVKLDRTKTIKTNSTPLPTTLIQQIQTPNSSSNSTSTIVERESTSVREKRAKFTSQRCATAPLQSLSYTVASPTVGHNIVDLQHSSHAPCVD